MAQSVVAGQLAPAAVLTVAVADDCCASGIVTCTALPPMVTLCSADTARSATIPVVPVVLVACPVIDAGAVLVPVTAFSGILPSEAPGCTPVVMLAAYETLLPFTAATTTS